MKIYIVTVIVGAGFNKRYFDSIWVRKDHAEERVKQVRAEFRRAGVPVESDGNPAADRWAVALTEALASDGQLADEQSPQAEKETP